MILLMLISCSCVLGLNLATDTGTGGSGSGTPPRGPRDCADVFRAGGQVEGYYAVFGNMSNPDEAGLIYCSVEDGFIPSNSSAPRASPKNCQDLKDGNMHESGINIIYPYAAHPETPVIVYCDQNTLNGGWTVFQRRDDYASQVDFYKSFEEYAQGFGNVGSEFWLGNDLLNELTEPSVSELYINLFDFDGANKYALYKSFYVSPRTGTPHNSKKPYQLAVSHYSGTAGDSFTENNGMGFTTGDADYDDYSGNCAQAWGGGGWWYSWGGGDWCGKTGLNGVYQEGTTFSQTVIHWWDFSDSQESLKRTTMMTRPLKQY